MARASCSRGLLLAALLCSSLLIVAAQDAAAVANAVNDTAPLNTTADAVTILQKAEEQAPEQPVAPVKKAKKKVESQIVTIAPKANVTNDDDVDNEGACVSEIAALCSGTEAGEGKLADCLSEAITESEDENKADGSSKVSDACREEVFQYKIERNTNINKNIPLARACKDDAVKQCNVTWFFGYKNGSIVACLRDVKDKVSAPCRKQLFKAQMDAARDYRADPNLHEACQKDANTLCKDVQAGGGRVQGCLRDKRMQLSWDCEEQLFRKEMEDAEDIRLSVRLFTKCLGDKKQFCSDVSPGNAQAKQCLEDHRDEVSSDCRGELDGMIERRVRDFRLDSRLRNACESDIFTMCAYLGDLDSMDTYDATVINCLQDYSTEISNDECRVQVKKYLQLAAEDIRFDVPLADACYDDRKALCSTVPPGSARVIRCLQTQRDKLSSSCRATLFDEEVRFSENIDFQYPMKKACTKEIQIFCKDVPHGNARVIRCLQDKKDSKDFGKSCKAEVSKYEQSTGKDYRLNFRLNKACKEDIKAICKDVCKVQDGEVCGGKVLQCLTEQKADLKADACKKEVFYFEKMEINDYRNDIMLAEACRNDVDKYCGKVKTGDGRIHKCLREHIKELSAPCKKEELRLEENEVDNIELNVGLLRACKDERQMFCGGVAPGQARVFRCLAENLGNPDFGDTCKHSITTKLARRQANWRLDPPLRKACKQDVSTLCTAEDELRSDSGVVIKCMIQQYAALREGCQRELSRSVHMAFFVWKEDSTITGPCDADIKSLCLSKDKDMNQTPGAVGSCLVEILEAQDGSPLSSVPARRRLLEDAKDKEDKKKGGVKEKKKDEKKKKKEEKKEKDNDKEEKKAKKEDKEEAKPVLVVPKKAAAAPKKGAATPAPKKAAPAIPQLSPQCRVIADIAEPPNAKKAFEKGLSNVWIQSHLENLEFSTGLPLVDRDRFGNARGISLTGWTAMAGITALIVLVITLSVFGYRRYRGLSDTAGYTLVVKHKPPTTGP